MMFDDPVSTVAISAFFALFFGFQVFDLIEKKRRAYAIGALVLFGVSFAFIMIDSKAIMYGPDLRGVAGDTP